MTLLFVLLGIAVITATALLAVGRLGGELPEPEGPAEPLAGVPVGEVTAADVAAVRLDQAVRGYRMDEVDALVARLTAELATRPPGSGVVAAAETAPDPESSDHNHARSGQEDG